jgi:oxygen-dependent protoporphyrinogen oxidase
MEKAGGFDLHMGRYDIIVIGGGISGLSFAHYSARANLKTLVIEKNNRVGGALHSHFFEGDAKDFWVELGGHTCYNSYGNLIGIMEDVGIIGDLKAPEKPPFKMLVNNVVKSIPSQLNFPALIPAVWRMKTVSKQGQTLKSYYSKVMGRANYERVLKHAFAAVSSQPADDFPADSLFNKRGRRQDIMRKYTFDGGVQNIPDAMAAKSGFKLLLDTTVNNIEVKNSGVTIVTDKGEFETDRLVVATPASVASELLKTAFPEVAAKLGEIKVCKVETVGVAVPKGAVSIDKFGSMVPRDDMFFSIVSRDGVPDDKFRGFTFHFKPGVADSEAKLKRISEALGVPRDQLTHVVIRDNFVPALKVGYKQVIAEIDRLTAKSALLLIGNYFDGMAIEDCLNRSRAEFDRLMAACAAHKSHVDTCVSC